MTTAVTRQPLLVAVLSILSLIVACQSPVGPETTNPSALLTMKAVPAGTFERSLSPGGMMVGGVFYPQPANMSTVSAFQVSETEVTREQYTTVTGLPDPSEVLYSTGPSDPVHNVSWYEALVFCNLLSLREGLTPIYSIGGSTDTSTWTAGQIPTYSSPAWNAVAANWNANGYRLPTDDEWLWAAMGGQGTYAKAFAGSAGGNSVGDYAWTNANASGRTHPVKSKLPNELGLYDMSGNVWELTWNWYSATPASGARTNDRGPTTATVAPNSSRTIWGGGWNDPSLTVSVRSLKAPNMHAVTIGFRVVRGLGN